MAKRDLKARVKPETPVAPDPVIINDADELRRLMKAGGGIGYDPVRGWYLSPSEKQVTDNAVLALQASK